MDVIIITNRLNSDRYGFLDPYPAQSRIRYERFKNKKWPFKLRDPASYGEFGGETDNLDDAPDALFAVFFRNGEAKANLRGVPTSSEFVGGTWMINDMAINVNNPDEAVVLNNMMEQMDREETRRMLFHPEALPKDPHVMEWSRMSCTLDLTPHERDYIMTQMMIATQKFGMFQKQKETILLMHPKLWNTRYRSKGCVVKPYGPVVSFLDEEDKREESQVCGVEVSQENLASLLSWVLDETMICYDIAGTHDLVVIERKGDTFDVALRRLTHTEYDALGFGRPPKREEKISMRPEFQYEPEETRPRPGAPPEDFERFEL